VAPDHPSPALPQQERSNASEGCHNDDHTLATLEVKAPAIPVNASPAPTPEAREETGGDASAPIVIQAPPEKTPCEDAAAQEETPATPEKVEGRMTTGWGAQKAWAVTRAAGIPVDTAPVQRPKECDFPALPEAAARPAAVPKSVTAALPPSRRSLSGSRTSSEGSDAPKTRGQRQLSAKAAEQRLAVDRIRAEIANNLKKGGRAMASFARAAPTSRPSYAGSRRDSGRGASDA
jgi:hypothetical protein